MHRVPLAVFLILGLSRVCALAQSSPDLPTSSSSRIEVEVHENYDVLPQGAEMKVAIVLSLPAQPAGLAPQFVHHARHLVPESVSTHLELDSAEGFRFGAVTPPSTNRRRFHFSSQPVEVLTPAFYYRPVAFRLEVKAIESIPVGNYVLRGKLTYRAVDDSGISPVKVLPIEIPIRVVDRSTKRTKGPWPYDNSQAKQTATLVLLAPVMIPLVVFGGLICVVSGNHNCD